MPRKTPEELQAARRAKAERDREEELKRAEAQEALSRQEQLRVSQLGECLNLQSAIKAIYIEADKLSKKSPVMSVSPLMLDRANRLIGQAVSLIGNRDSQIEGVGVLTEAGDTIEMRDLVLTLGELDSALARLRRLLMNLEPGEDSVFEGLVLGWDDN